MSQAQTPRSPRLLDRLQQLALAKYGRPEPGKRAVVWARRFILFHGTRHPNTMREPEIVRYLEHVAVTEKDRLNSLEQAHEAITLLYEDLLNIRLGEILIPQPPRMLDRIRWAIRTRHFSARTEECYVDWAARYIRFHGMRHPNTMGEPEIEMFLTDLAVREHVSASTQNQAFHALLFLYQQVLGIELAQMNAVRAKRPKRLPTVLSQEEVQQLLDQVRGGEGVFRLMASLLYGAGLRREECCRLRVQDVDLGRGQIIVRCRWLPAKLLF